MNPVIQLFNLYSNKNYFLCYRKQFLELLVKVGSKLGLKVSFNRSFKKYDLYQVMINNLILEVKEFGEPKVKKGKLNNDELNRLLKSLMLADKTLFKMISNELKKFDLTPFNVYCALTESMNNFRFRVEHLKSFLKCDVSVIKDKLIISDKNNQVSFKLIRKQSPKDLWKSYHSFKGDKFNKVLTYGSPSNFMLGRPFIFKLSEGGVEVVGAVNGVLKKVNDLLIKYFNDFIKMNTYVIKLSSADKGLLSVILLKLFDNNNEATNARLVMDYVLKSKNDLLLPDELRDWLFGFLVKLGKKAKGDDVLTSLINSVRDAGFK